jgi:hypothetical protein
MPSVAILAIFKNEAQTLVEWLSHHELEGVSQFVLLDQDSDDGGAAIARAWAREKAPAVKRHPRSHFWQRNLIIVNATRRPKAETQHGGRCPSMYSCGVDQVIWYNRAFHHVTADWVMVIDVDEYVYARGRFQTIPSYLASLPLSHRGLIALPWKQFGSSGIHKQPRSVISSFLRHRQDDPHTVAPIIEFKSLAHRATLLEVFKNVSSARAASGKPALPGPVEHQHRASFHVPLTTPDGVSDPAWEKLYSNMHGKRFGPFTTSMLHSFSLHINHYSVGSCEFYCRVRQTRGSVINSQPDALRNFRHLHNLDAHSNAAIDDELKRKRGQEWPAQLPAERPWPTTAHVGKYSKHLDAHAWTDEGGCNSVRCHCGGYQWSQERASQNGTTLYVS